MFNTAQYTVSALSFALRDDIGAVAVIDGEIVSGRERWRPKLVLKPLPNGQWQLIGIEGPFPQLAQEALQQVVNCAGRILMTTNLWPNQQQDGSATICMNMLSIPDEAKDKVVASFRVNALDIANSDWKTLWDRIQARVEADPCFEVLGFDNGAVQRAVLNLRRVFPWEWVRARYKAAGLARLADSLATSAEGWFPAYHLARTANGAICRDPGWNYLVELGLAIETLSKFPGADRLIGRLTKSSGTQHHICMAAELLQRGFLQGLEPSTGRGAASSDLLVGTVGTSYQVEVKEFSSKDPLNSLRKEIADKHKKLPASPKQPVVFHAVLLEKGQLETKQVFDFDRAVNALRDELPSTISAVVSGKRFLDSRGGRVKRDVGAVVINRNALRAASERDLHEIFRANFDECLYPIFGVGFGFMFNKQETS